MAHSMAVNVDVFDGLGNLSIVQHREGNPVQVVTGRSSVNLRAGDCFLLPPDRPYQAAWNSVGVTLTTLDFENLQRDAAGWSIMRRSTSTSRDPSRQQLDAIGLRPSGTWSASSAPARCWQSAPLARRELGWLVNSAVLACFPNSTLDAESASYAGDTPQPLRRALEFIDEHAGDPISLNEIAVAARLSPRGLQAAFRRHLDTTPLAHLRSVRMERAHRDLQNADPGDGASVAAVAARWGFTHLGRFAIEYRRRFGIYPSQTLRG